MAFLQSNPQLRLQRPGRPPTADCKCQMPIKQYSNVTDIVWQEFIDENSDKADDWWRRYRAQDYGYNYDKKYMLALFLVNMQALSDKGWRLPPGIKYAQLDKIHQLVKK